MTGGGQEGPLSPCVSEVKMGEEEANHFVLLMYTRSTQTPRNALSAQAHTLEPKVPNPSLEGGSDRFPTLTGDTRG